MEGESRRCINTGSESCLWFGLGRNLAWNLAVYPSSEEPFVEGLSTLSRPDSVHGVMHGVMSGVIHEWIHEWSHEWTHGWSHERSHERTHEWSHQRSHEWRALNPHPPRFGS